MPASRICSLCVIERIFQYINSLTVVWHDTGPDCKRAQWRLAHASWMSKCAEWNASMKGVMIDDAVKSSSSNNPTAAGRGRIQNPKNGNTNT